ncbi:Tex-like N-terminal domain-containing protein [Tundrisphaera sp. TA3]|uniref:Tex-like N-terminal domain-containing protein n=1 Tax=Tundrisphaera sp. TA3 TaxID=3435775 RepID=UPI003EBF115F
MDNPIQVDLGRIAQDLQIRRVQVESVVQLLDEGNTVPFITRYRKERTGNLNEVAIREIQLRVGRLRELAERKETILKAIEAQGKLSDELAAAIRAADNSKRLEDLYLPFKPKKKTKASDARERGLEPLALRVWNHDETLTDLPGAAAEFVNPEKELDTVEKVLEGVGHILAEAINELAVVRDAVRRVVWKTGKVSTTKSDIPEGEGLEYRDYFAYSEPIAQIPPHRVLAINRGDKEGPLKVKLDVSRADLESATFAQLPLDGHPQADFFRASALDALDRLLMPSMEREVRRDLTEMAERHAVDVFARNLRSLLLQPPIPKQVVLAIDPGFRNGCKVAVLGEHGELLDHGVMHPHPPQNRRHEAKVYLKDLVGKHKVGVVAIGNGTACRETEELIAEIISEGTHFHNNPDAALAVPETPAAEATPAEGQATETPAEGSAEAPPADAGATPAVEAHASTNGDGASEPQATPAGEGSGSSSESIPPISGGAPAEGEEKPEANNPGENPPPPPSATSEGETPERHADQADALEHSEQTRNPANQETPKPISGGSPEADEEPKPAEPTAAELTPPPSASDTPPPPTSGSAPAPDEPAATPSHLPADGIRDEIPAIDPAASKPAEPGAEASQPAEPKAEATVTAEPKAEGTGDAPEIVLPEHGVKDVIPSGTPTPPESGVKDVLPADAATAGGEGQGRKENQPRGSKGGRSGKGGDNPRPAKPKGPPPPPRPHAADAQLAQLAYVIVNEAGASVYSVSPVGREEFPDFDDKVRGTISIGRRLQDPLAELVKIEPQNIGVGLYQHDVNPKQLKESLEGVISSCVNFVGVDLNTASIPLLRHVSGMNQLTARRVVERRAQQGPYTSRAQLMEVEGVGPSTFTQAAGFLKLGGGENPLDRTWVHPESYATAEKVLEKLGFTPDVVRQRERLPELHAKLDEADVAAMARELEVGEPTLRDIFEALARPERDPRDDLPKPIFKKGVLKLEDLEAGMELKGTVLNVVDFGAFVDIGLKDSGLVHISQLANRYIKSPHDVVSVGDVVSVWVMGVDGERKRVSLTMVKPGTERPRSERGPAGAGAGGGRRPQGEGQEGRGGARRPAGPGGPRRESAPPSQLTSPPAGGGPGGARPGDRAPFRGPAGGGGSRFGGPNRGGSRFGGQGGGRPPEPSAPKTVLPPRPAKPAPPPPPLSKDALAGSVPLRSFGQLKQLWQARDEPEGEGGSTPPAEGSAPAPEGTPTPTPPSTPESGS